MTKIQEPVSIKWIHLVISVLVLLGAIAANIWAASSWTTHTINRVERLEESTMLIRAQSVILIELKYNTIRLMREQGMEYETLPDKVLLEYLKEGKRHGG